MWSIVFAPDQIDQSRREIETNDQSGFDTGTNQRLDVRPSFTRRTVQDLAGPIVTSIPTLVCGFRVSGCKVRTEGVRRGRNYFHLPHHACHALFNLFLVGGRPPSQLRQAGPLLMHAIHETHQNGNVLVAFQLFLFALTGYCGG